MCDKHAMITPVIALALALAIPSEPVVWRTHSTRPNDADVSCFQNANQTWTCAADRALARDEVDPDDSY